MKLFLSCDGQNLSRAKDPGIKIDDLAHGKQLRIDDRSFVNGHQPPSEICDDLCQGQWEGPPSTVPHHSKSTLFGCTDKCPSARQPRDHSSRAESTKDLPGPWVSSKPLELSSGSPKLLQASWGPQGGVATRQEDR